MRARGVATRTRHAALAVLERLDGWANRVYGWRHNPLYHSGAVAVWSLVVLLVTGLYLLLFYRVGDPWASVVRLSDQAWGGRWIRTLHRYVSDVAVVAVAVHAFRMFAQGRSWGARSLAWLSGLLLVGVILVAGWTGYVMVWDGQALALAAEGARLLDALPLFSEPVARAFAGEGPLPGAFFFLNLFLHIALPVGLALLLWVHVSRVARPTLLPPPVLRNGLLLLLLAASVVWPVAAGEPADLGRIPGEVPLDVFYAFWLPVSRALPPWAAWAGLTVAVLLVATVPLWTRPPAPARPAPSVVDERLCTGCTQCMLDCPYEAITMVARADSGDDAAGLRSELVARVDPALCVSCGICAGSCAPMGVGPPGRTGRDQLADVRAFLEAERPGPGDVVVVGCARSGAGSAPAGTLLLPVSCAGNLHTSAIEILVRGGAGGVLVVSCPPRDCWNREGVRWLGARVRDGREAELKERVDRRRVRLVSAAAAEGALLRDAVASFRADVKALARAVAEEDPEVDTECEPALEPEEALAWKSR